MLIVGELINSSRKAIALAIEQRDEEYLQNLARVQAEAGADFIDVNTAVGANEIENMIWLVDIIQEATIVPLCIDSPNPLALEAGLQRLKKKALLNSISAEKERWEAVLPLIQRYKTKVVALCMDDSGIPKTAEQRIKVADCLISGLTEAGVEPSDIYLDPLVKPLAVNHEFGLEVLNDISALRSKYPLVHIISGLSNVSYGLPERRLLNRAYLAMSLAMGMDAFILDPLDRNMMSMLAAATLLAGKDEYCMNYISGVRAGKIKA